MKNLWPLLAAQLVVLAVPTLGQEAPPAGMGFRPGSLEAERKHFLQCLAYVYSPGLWISYEGALYFAPKNAAQEEEIQRMKTDRGRYAVLREHTARHEIAANAMAAAGLSEKWQKLILLPVSGTNQNLTPTLDRQLRIVPQYKVAQKYPGGDALLENEEWSGFVMGYGRAVQDRYLTNALLIREGTKSFMTATGEPRRVEAFTDVGLSQEEESVLARVAAECAREALGTSKKSVASAQGTEAEKEFQVYKARASDASPYFQFLLAKAYLEGRGTPRDEGLGLEWMKKAAANGSGDATAYLAANQEKK